MLGTLYVVMSSEKDEDYQMLKEKLLKINPRFSISPYRESNMTKNASEFFVTFEIYPKRLCYICVIMQNIQYLDLLM